MKFLTDDIAVVNVMSFVTHRRTERWSCASAHNTDVIVGAETNIVDQEGVFRSADYRQP